MILLKISNEIEDSNRKKIQLNIFRFWQVRNDSSDSNSDGLFEVKNIHIGSDLVKGTIGAIAKASLHMAIVTAYEPNKILYFFYF